MRKILFVVGTRPEIIKTAPVIAALKSARRHAVRVCFTGQHRAMALQMIREFGLTVDEDLNLMRPRQTLASLAASALSKLTRVYEQWRPDMVMVQGDTTTALAAALAAYYSRIPVGHIEAGLRTGDKYEPYPEELNRSMISRIADLHFAPTKEARENLIREGVPPTRIAVTGNTTIDALLQMRKRCGSSSSCRLTGLPPDKRMILLTAHRRENLGAPLRRICAAVKEIVRMHPDVAVVYPVHRNPDVDGPVRTALSGVKNVFLIPPAGYRDFVALMDRSFLVLTDSGGIQEEAPSLGKPVLVLRDKTERPEVVRAGCAKLVGTRTAGIVTACARLLTDGKLYRRMSRKRNPVGDGKAAARIVKRLDAFL